MDKRAQAAMEFLMTYGWAILAAIIAVGVLAYIGLTDPFNWFGGVPANVQAPFNVQASLVNTTAIRLEMMHTNPKAINITSLTISNCGSANSSILGSTLRVPNNYTIYTVDCSPALTSGDVLSGTITVTYTESGSNLPQTRTGSITQKVI